MTKPNSVLIAISDKNKCRDVSAAIDKFGITTQTVVHDIGSALSALKVGGFDCVVLDWKWEKTSGAAIVNRLRQDERYQLIPVIVVSDLKQKENFTLLKDYPFTGVADGTFSPAGFGVKFEILLHEFRNGWSNRDAVEKIAQMYLADPAQGREGLNQLVQGQTHPSPFFNAIARRLQAQGNWQESEVLAKEALVKERESVCARLTLVRALCATNRAEEAKTALTQCHFSSKNTDGQLLGGYIALAGGLVEEAKKAYQAALEIDHELEVAKAGIQLAEQILPLIKKKPLSKRPEGLAEMLELVAGPLVEAKVEDACLALFKSGLLLAFDANTKAAITYNIGMSFVRTHKKVEALEWMKQSENIGGPSFTRAKEQIKLLTTPPPPIKLPVAAAPAGATPKTAVGKAAIPAQKTGLKKAN